MQKSFLFLISLALAVTAGAQRDAGVVELKGDGQTMAVAVSANVPELQALARQAFGAHGRYRVEAKGQYDIAFSSPGGNQVTVTITKGGAAVHTSTVAGTSPRNALLRAADVAIQKTSGLKGIFSAKLAFVSERGGSETVFTGDLFFGEVLSHPVQGKQILGPRWSPDGSKILFTSYRSGFPDIYELDLRSKKLNIFASFKGTNSGARFSPDGTKVAMILSGEGNPEVYVGNANGRQIRRLTNNQSVEASPEWSPDGTKLIFTSDAAGVPQLHVMPATGGAMTRVATNISKYCAEPDWSTADPKKIVFTAGVGKGFQSAVYDFGTGTSKIVTKAPMDATEPVWLADGRHILCTFRTASARAIYLVDTESGKATRISPSGLGSAWSASVLTQ
jgi:TolB protein